MQPLIKIPLIDLRGHTPLELLFVFRKEALALADGAANLLGGPASRLVFKASDRASRRWLEKTRNPYLQEISLIDAALPIRGTYTLNTCLEWGCTSGTWAGDAGPLLRRVLDWPFPRLGELVVVAQFAGKAGNFYSITWPGYSGILQGMAPGRFAAAVNQAPMRKHGAGFVGDWVAGKFHLNRAMGLPPTHLLRRAFETARDYTAAKAMLSMTPVAVPVIFALTGTQAGEGCIIERTENSYAVREMAASRVCAANLFESRLKTTGRGWRARPIDSDGRFVQAMELTDPTDGFAWFTPPIANRNSRLVVTANAAAGSLKVMGVEGIRPVTEIFDLPG